MGFRCHCRWAGLPARLALSTQGAQWELAHTRCTSSQAGFLGQNDGVLCEDEITGGVKRKSFPAQPDNGAGSWELNVVSSPFD